MGARVLDVGQCDPDHSAIRRMLDGHFAVEIDRVMFVEEALDRLAQNRYDLVLVNRLIFADQSDGAELIRRMKEDATLADTPIMLVSNHAEAQRRAVRLGAAPGFGKAALDSRVTLERLAGYLPRRPAVRANE